MKVIMVGYARSGTKSIAHFFKQFGISAFHQRVMPGHLRDEWGRKCDHPYDYKDIPPPHVESFLERQDAVLNKFDSYFEANWSKSYYMLPTHQRHPDIEWLVMIRDPILATNSLKAHRRYGVPLRDLGVHYSELYLAILQQIKRMNKAKIRWLDFEKYITGKYIKGLLGMYGIEESEENLKMAESFLSQKVNPGRNEYKPYDDSQMFPKWFSNATDSFFTFADRVVDCVKESVSELGEK